LLQYVKNKINKIKKFQEAATSNLFPANRRPHRLAEVKRSDSLRSQSSSASDSKRVSFNNDVKVKRIPNKSKLATQQQQQQQQQQQKQHQQQQQQFAEYQTEEPPTDPKRVAEEAENILRQLVSAVLLVSFMLLLSYEVGF
jgi:hypothetical protein